MSSVSPLLLPERKPPQLSIDHVDLHGVSALMDACGRGDTALVEWLIENRARLDLTTHDGCQAIDFASVRGHTHIVTLLHLHEAPDSIASIDALAALRQRLEEEHARRTRKRGGAGGGGGGGGGDATDGADAGEASSHILSISGAKTLARLSGAVEIEEASPAASTITGAGSISSSSAASASASHLRHPTPPLPHSTHPSMLIDTSDSPTDSPTSDGAVHHEYFSPKHHEHPHRNALMSPLASSPVKRIGPPTVPPGSGGSTASSSSAASSFNLPRSHPLKVQSTNSSNSNSSSRINTPSSVRGNTSHLPLSSPSPPPSLPEDSAMHTIPTHPVPIASATNSSASSTHTLRSTSSAASMSASGVPTAYNVNPSSSPLSPMALEHVLHPTQRHTQVMMSTTPAAAAMSMSAISSSLQFSHSPSPSPQPPLSSLHIVHSPFLASLQPPLHTGTNSFSPSPPHPHGGIFSLGTHPHSHSHSHAHHQSLGLAVAASSSGLSGLNAGGLSSANTHARLLSKASHIGAGATSHNVAASATATQNAHNSSASPIANVFAGSPQQVQNVWPASSSSKLPQPPTSSSNARTVSSPAAATVVGKNSVGAAPSSASLANSSHAITHHAYTPSTIAQPRPTRAASGEFPSGFMARSMASPPVGVSGRQWSEPDLGQHSHSSHAHPSGVQSSASSRRTSRGLDSDVATHMHRPHPTMMQLHHSHSQSQIYIEPDVLTVATLLNLLFLASSTRGAEMRNTFLLTLPYFASSYDERRVVIEELLRRLEEPPRDDGVLENELQSDELRGFSSGTSTPYHPHHISHAVSSYDIRSLSRRGSGVFSSPPPPLSSGLQKETNSPYQTRTASNSTGAPPPGHVFLAHQQQQPTTPATSSVSHALKRSTSGTFAPSPSASPAPGSGSGNASSSPATGPISTTTVSQQNTTWLASKLRTFSVLKYWLKEYPLDFLGIVGADTSSATPPIELRTLLLQRLQHFPPPSWGCFAHVSNSSQPVDLNATIPLSDACTCSSAVAGILKLASSTMKTLLSLSATNVTRMSLTRSSSLVSDNSNDASISSPLTHSSTMASLNATAASRTQTSGLLDLSVEVLSQLLHAWTVTRFQDISSPREMLNTPQITPTPVPVADPAHPPSSNRNQMKLSNRISLWVCTEFLCAGLTASQISGDTVTNGPIAPLDTAWLHTQRLRVYKKFFGVAITLLLKYGNFNAFFELLIGLNMQPAHRLSARFDLVASSSASNSTPISPGVSGGATVTTVLPPAFTEGERRTMKKCNEVMSSGENYRLYRSLYSSSDAQALSQLLTSLSWPSCDILLPNVSELPDIRVPYLGVVCKDLVALEEGQPDLVMKPMMMKADENEKEKAAAAAATDGLMNEHGVTRTDNLNPDPTSTLPSMSTNSVAATLLATQVHFAKLRSISNLLFDALRCQSIDVAELPLVKPEMIQRVNSVFLGTNSSSNSNNNNNNNNNNNSNYNYSSSSSLVLQEDALMALSERIQPRVKRASFGGHHASASVVMPPQPDPTPRPPNPFSLRALPPPSDEMLRRAATHT